MSAEGGLAGIREQLDKQGPKSEVTGRRFDGLTTWGLRWGFAFQEVDGACGVRNATIEVEAVITLPELTAADALSPEESGLWEDYGLQLRAHEDGHVNIYRAGAQELSQEIVALGALPDCDQLRRALTALGDAKIERIRRADIDFDLETGHGAIFPGRD